MSRRRKGGFQRRLSAKEHWDMHYGPNMTPMVDVVMVILVFFMASTAVVGPQWMLRSALPVKSSAAPAPNDKEQVRLDVAVTLGPGGASVVKGAGLDGASLEALRDLLTQKAGAAGAQNVALLVTPAPDVPYSEIVKMHEMCHALGITKIGMLESTSAR